MVDVKVTPEMVMELQSLLSNFGMFMSLNLVHADQRLTGDAQSKVQELIQYSIKHNHITNVIETPITSHMNRNIKVVSENLETILKFMYNYLKYAKPIVVKFIPSRLERIENMEQEYSGFMKKYF